MKNDKQEMHYTKKSLHDFLEKKESLRQVEVGKVKAHLNSCRDCWNIWNTVRWDRAIGSRGLEELELFLGDNFQEYFDSSWALAEEWNSKPRDTEESVENFYINTPHYLYNSLIFYESGDREDMTEDMNTILNSHEISSVLDYGAGIGNDSLCFLEKGLEVYHADFDSPVSKFLKFRAGHRGLDKKLHFVDVTKCEVPSVDLIWTIDTLEHMTDPYKIFDYVTAQTKVFAYFIDDDTEAGGRHPFHTVFKYDQFNNKLMEKGFKQVNSNKLSSWSKVWSRLI